MLNLIKSCGIIILPIFKGGIIYAHTVVYSVHCRLQRFFFLFPNIDGKKNPFRWANESFWPADFKTF